MDTKTRQPLQDEYVLHKKWIFQRRNYVHTTDESRDIMDHVFKITTRVAETKSHVDFMRLIFAMLNATPMHRGSALVAKIYSMAVYAYVFGTPMPPMPDGFDVFAMLEPNFETFDQRYRSVFFPSSNEM